MLSPYVTLSLLPGLREKKPCLRGDAIRRHFCQVRLQSSEIPKSVSRLEGCLKGLHYIAATWTSIPSKDKINRERAPSSPKGDFSMFEEHWLLESPLFYWIEFSLPVTPTHEYSVCPMERQWVNQIPIPVNCQVWLIEVLSLVPLQYVVSRDMGYRTSLTGVWIAALPFSSSMTSDKSLKLSESQFFSSAKWG